MSLTSDTALVYFAPALTTQVLCGICYFLSKLPFCKKPLKHNNLELNTQSICNAPAMHILRISL